MGINVLRRRRRRKTGVFREQRANKVGSLLPKNLFPEAAKQPREIKYAFQKGYAHPSNSSLISMIPSVKFPNRQQKDFEFEIISNKEMLLYDIPTDHNPFRPHRLRFYAILFIINGEGQHFIDFKTYHYKRGTIIFISKEQVHAFQPNLEREASFMLFTEKFLEKSSAGSNLMQRLSLYNYHLYPPLLQIENERQIEIFANLIRQIRAEFDAPDDSFTEEIIASALKIFLCMAERIRKKSLGKQMPLTYREEFLTLQNLLREHLFENRQVNFYAEQMAISAKKLNMLTQEVVGKSAKTYINEQLILEIKRFLMNTALSTKEIAYQTGFEEPTNFVKFFKKYVGQTPLEFRKAF